MARTTGTIRSATYGDEIVRAFIPAPLPPADPPLVLEGELARLHVEAHAALSRLQVAAHLVPSQQWFLYGFVRKEAVVSSQIEGTQATLQDVLSFEATHQTSKPLEVEEICNYVDAVRHARKRLADPKGIPLCSRLLCEAHARLMHGVRGAEKAPGTIRTTQNWIGGSRPSTAAYVPPPPDQVPEALSALDRWIHSADALPPLVRAGLAHVQFETIHPFLDGNGRIGRLLIALLVEHWGILDGPLLYLSLAFKRHRADYYRHLSQVRTVGDWEGWTSFFLTCVIEAAEDGIAASIRLFTLIDRDRRRLTALPSTSMSVMRLFALLPEHPVIRLPLVVRMLATSKPTASKAIQGLVDAGILSETTGMQRDRIYNYRAYLKILCEDTLSLPG
jgi:Fic family protein